MSRVTPCCGARPIRSEAECTSSYGERKVTERWWGLYCPECGDPVDDERLVWEDEWEEKQAARASR